MKHHKVYRTELSPVSFLQRSAYVFPGKPAVIHGKRQYTYRQFEERVNRLASALRRAEASRLTRSSNSRYVYWRLPWTTAGLPGKT